MVVKDKNYWMKRLIDFYGFSYESAEEILNQSNSELIVTSIVSAYIKGREKGTETYNYSGGL